MRGNSRDAGTGVVEDSILIVPLSIISTRFGT